MKNLPKKVYNLEVDMCSHCLFFTHMWKVEDKHKIRWKHSLKHEDIYICDHPKITIFQLHNVIVEGKSDELDFENIELPKWCPLEDYKDPGVKVGVSVMMVRDKKVLLGERGKEVETAKNKYAFPGGRMNFGEERIEKALIREIKEETGLIVEEKDLKFLRPVNEYFPEEEKHYVTLTYLLYLKDGEPKTIEGEGKCKRWEWFGLDGLPENILIYAKETINLFYSSIKQGNPND